VTHASVDEFLLDAGGQVVWELFHENSKTSRYERHPYYPHHPSDAEVVEMMRRLRTVKPYADSPRTVLPPARALGRPIGEALTGRVSARGFGSGEIALGALSTVLALSGGVMRDERDAGYPRPFRAVPSGGALYPLELYVAARAVADLTVGLYHYDPEHHTLAGLRCDVPALIACSVQPELLGAAAAVILVSAVFVRSTFKYGDRGYRFALLEAGHLGQNAVLAAGAEGLAALPVGGYFDREVDALLELDGVDESVVYMLALGVRP
jgi:SagB-type dehydrogenase family enzyme